MNPDLTRDGDEGQDPYQGPMAYTSVWLEGRKYDMQIFIGLLWAKMSRDYQRFRINPITHGTKVTMHLTMHFLGTFSIPVTVVPTAKCLYTRHTSLI